MITLSQSFVCVTRNITYEGGWQSYDFTDTWALPKENFTMAILSVYLTAQCGLITQIGSNQVSHGLPSRETVRMLEAKAR